MRLTFTLMISLCILCGSSQAEDTVKQIEPVALIRGSIDDDSDRAAQRLSPDGRLIDQEFLERLWKAWKIRAEMPKVDFEKQFVVTTTWGGSRQDLHWMVLPDGKFFFGGGGTKDIKPGFRYSIGVFNWEGVQTVNGFRNPTLEKKEDKPDKPQE